MRKMLAIAMLTAVFGLTFGCQTTPTQQGALLGGALGAGAGAIIGNQSGHQGEGALIGAGAGALAGALAGDQVDEQRTYQGAPQYPAASASGQRGHYETRLVKGISGETYEERVWVPDR